MEFRQKIVNGQLRIYVGRKRATEEQKKHYYRLNYDLIDKNTVSKEDYKFIYRVKGGKKRASQAITSKGKFLSKQLADKAVKIAQQKGVDLQKLMKQKKKNSIAELFKDFPKIKESFDKLFNESGIYYWFNASKVVEKLTEYAGDEIEINSEVEVKEFAIPIFADIIQEINNKFNPVNIIVKLSYFGYDKLSLLPTLTLIDVMEMTDGEDNEMQPYADEIIIFVSSKKENKRKSKNGKKNTRKKSNTGK